MSDLGTITRQPLNITVPFTIEITEDSLLEVVFLIRISQLKLSFLITIQTIELIYAQQMCGAPSCLNTGTILKMQFEDFQDILWFWLNPQAHCFPRVIPIDSYFFSVGVKYR